MRLLAITTFPPSVRPHSSFANHAIMRFLEAPDIEQIIVLADILTSDEIVNLSPRLLVNRCWHYNSPSTLFRLINLVSYYRPNVVWVSLHYTLFSSNPVYIVSEMLLPILLKRMGFSVILVLHNFLDVVDLDEVRFTPNKNTRLLAKLANTLVMRSLMSSDKIFTMVKEFDTRLRLQYPYSKVQFVEQDLYTKPPFQNINNKYQNILIMGYYGTQKRLELLIEAFQLVRDEFPDSHLLIAGHSHPRNPNYLKEISHKYSSKLNHVHMLGYIEESQIAQVFWTSNVVIVTNSGSTGSSAILRYCAVFGRGLVAPHAGSFAKLPSENWGVITYEQNSTRDLARVLAKILVNPELQLEIALKNYEKTNHFEDTFIKEHLKTIREIKPHF